MEVRTQLESICHREIEAMLLEQNAVRKQTHLTTTGSNTESGRVILSERRSHRPHRIHFLSSKHHPGGRNPRPFLPNRILLLRLSQLYHPRLLLHCLRTLPTAMDSTERDRSSKRSRRRSRRNPVDFHRVHRLRPLAGLHRPLYSPPRFSSDGDHATASRRSLRRRLRTLASPRRGRHLPPAELCPTRTRHWLRYSLRRAGHTGPLPCLRDGVSVAGERVRPRVVGGE